MGDRIIDKIGKQKGSSCVTLVAVMLLTLTSACNQGTQNPENTATSTPQEKASVSTPTSQSPKIKVVTTFLPMYWFTKAVTGDLADVEILVPPGTEIHEYQAKPENVKAIATAKVLIKNGLGLEEFLAATVKNAQNTKLIEVDASKGIKPLGEISPVVEIAKGEKDHDHESGNPHVWLDPVLAKQQITNIRDGLIAADPQNKTTYEQNAANYIQQLEQLNQEFQQTLQKTSICTFITFHDAFPYIAKRYNLKQIAVVSLPEDQLSPQDVQNVISTVKKYQVKALFSEPGVDNKLLKSLSQDLNLKLQTLDSLETGKKEPQYYFQAMKTNLQTLAAACK